MATVGRQTLHTGPCATPEDSQAAIQKVIESIGNPGPGGPGDTSYGNVYYDETNNTFIIVNEGNNVTNLPPDAGMGPTGAGCGLTQSGDTLEIDAAAFAGAGLTGSGCTLDVNVGCGLAIDEGGAISIVAGRGLSLFEDCSLNLDFDAGCGLHLDASGAVAVDVASLAGAGLQAIGCTLNVTPYESGFGCGLQQNEEDDEIIEVDTNALIGTGLILEEPCGIAVDLGCSMEVDGNELGVNLGAIAGPGLDEGNCFLLVDTGCGIKIDGGAVAVDNDAISQEADYIISKGDCGLEVKTVPVTVVQSIDSITVEEDPAETLKITVNYTPVTLEVLAEVAGEAIPVTDSLAGEEC